MTIETGVRNLNVNFYNPSNRFEYGVAYDLEALERASHIGDCRLLQQTNQNQPPSSEAQSGSPEEEEEYQVSFLGLWLSLSLLFMFLIPFRCLMAIFIELRSCHSRMVDGI